MEEVNRENNVQRGKRTWRRTQGRRTLNSMHGRRTLNLAHMIMKNYENRDEKQEMNVRTREQRIS